jgi:hypothetical protein
MAGDSVIKAIKKNTSNADSVKLNTFRFKSA